MASWAEQQLGDIDIVVNNAGHGGDKPFATMSVADWDRMIAVHLRGTFLVTHAFFDKMCKRGFGRIISTSSQLAYKGSPGLVHYSAAKAGILGFTRALAYEGAPHNVTVNAVSPGPINTELTRGMSAEFLAMKSAQVPLGRFGEPEEIAPTVLLLASNAGSFYTGQGLSPNGGDVMI
jgi:3-oxoacyl-[acyl-carrier protein] reductase